MQFQNFAGRFLWGARAVLTIGKQTEDLMQLPHARHYPPYVTVFQPGPG